MPNLRTYIAIVLKKELLAHTFNTLLKHDRKDPPNYNYFKLPVISYQLFSLVYVRGPDHFTMLPPKSHFDKKIERRENETH